MTAQTSPRTLVRLVAVIIVSCVVSTILAGPPRADAADGYGITTAGDLWHNASLLEGRAAGDKAILPSLH